MPSSGVQTCADRKSTRLNSSHTLISYAVFCLKKKKICYATKNLQAADNQNAAHSHALLRHHEPPGRSTAYAAVLLPLSLSSFFFFFNDTATTEIYTLSLHDALPIYSSHTLISYAVFCLRDESVTG